MAASNQHPEQPSALDPVDCEKAIRREKLRLKHIIIEQHRTKANLARLVAKKEDGKADRLSDAIGEPTVQITQDAMPAILRLDLAQTLRSTHTKRSETATPWPQIAPQNRNPLERKKIAASSPLPVISSPTKSQLLRKPTPRKKQFSWRKSPHWFWSVGVHAACLLAAALATFATLPEARVFLTANAPRDDEDVIPQLAEFELEPVQPEEVQFEDLPGEVSEFESLDFTQEIAAPFEAAEASLLNTPTAVDLLASDLGALLAGVSADGGEGGASAGGLRGAKATEASFFGAKSRGSRFVFLVDNSGSMVDGRLETTLMELQRSVEALKEDQLFSIVFYSDQVYPLFYPKSVEELVPATRENKQKVAQWLPTVEMCLGGRLREAIEMVETLDPQVVYLLSDGDIRSEPLMRELTEPNDRKFAIHTFGMTVRNPDHMAKLSAIAAAHRGQFVPVRVHPVAVQMARQRPIKYHREPGQVWGTAVRPWR